MNADTPVPSGTVVASLGAMQAVAEQTLLRLFSPPAVLVTAQGDILYVSGRTGRYLEPAAGKANWNLHVMLRPSIRAPIAAAVRGITQDGQIELRGLDLEDGSGIRIDVIVQAITNRSTPDRPAQGGAEQSAILVVFRDVLETGPISALLPAETDHPAQVLQLARVNEEVRLLREQMRLSSDELQAANEELQSANEELQSANEELMTSKEEAQSMNEELQTINNELQTKLDDLALSQSDMQNLLNSTDIATLFLDSRLNVRRFTDRITRIVNLRESDIGRPLSDLTSTLEYPDLDSDARQTLVTLKACEKQIPTTDASWYSVRIMPYRTMNDVVDGLVITFVDITAAKRLERQTPDES